MHTFYFKRFKIVGAREKRDNSTTMNFSGNGNQGLDEHVRSDDIRIPLGF